MLPSLAWEGALVGMRVVFAPVDPDATRVRYTKARQRALDAMAPQEGEALAFDPSPRNLQEYPRDKLSDEYELRHFVLDPRRFDAAMVAEVGYQPK